MELGEWAEDAGERENKEKSKLRKESFIYYLDRELFGELAVVRVKKGLVYSVSQEGKVIKLYGKKVYPPELHVYSTVKRIKNEDLENIYKRAHDKIFKYENKLHNALLPYKGKTKLFIRCEMVQSSDVSGMWIFTEVIHIAKGDIY